jgi:hypothetical protein
MDMVGDSGRFGYVFRLTFLTQRFALELLVA